jgi:chaperone required for assembly of F1-ATPase
MTLRALKRNYKDVVVGSVDGSPAVLLDDRPLRTPTQAILILPNAALAAGIAEEWRDQGDEVQPFSMPLTRIAVSAIDQVVPARDEIVRQVVGYGETDLLCYRSEREELAARQAERWQPLLEWAAETLAVSLVSVAGIMPVTQESTSLDALRCAVEPHGDMELAALHLVTTTTGSVILALALSRGEIDAGAAWDLSRVDEAWQAEHWGEDAEAAERADQHRHELLAVACFFVLCRAA